MSRNLKRRSVRQPPPMPPRVRTERQTPPMPPMPPMAPMATPEERAALRDRMLAAGMTVSEMAPLLGVSQPMLSHMLRGDTPPRRLGAHWLVAAHHILDRYEQAVLVARRHFMAARHELRQYDLPVPMALYALDNRVNATLRYTPRDPAYHAFLPAPNLIQEVPDVAAITPAAITPAAANPAITPAAANPASASPASPEDTAQTRASTQTGTVASLAV